MRTLLVSSSFALILTVFARVAVAEPAPATPSPPEGDVSASAQVEAAKRFEDAVQLAREGRNDLALVELRRAYELTKNYRVLYNIGVVLDRLGRYAESVATYEQYLAEGGAAIAPERREEVDKTLSVLRTRTARIRIVIGGGLEGVTVEVAQKVVPKSQQSGLMIDAGPSEIVATKPGYEPYRQNVVLAGGDEKTVTITLKKAEAIVVDHRTSPYPWIGWGVSAAFAVGTVASALAWDGAESDLARAKNRFPFAPEDERRDLAGKVDKLKALTFVAGGLTLAAAGVSLYLTVRKDGDASGRVGRLRLGPAREGERAIRLEPTLGGMVLRSQF